MHKISLQKNKGVSLVEMLVYVAVLALISVVVISTTVSFSRSYHTLAVLRNIEHSAVSAMERMTRDVREASSVDVTGSVLYPTSPGTLTLIQDQAGGTKIIKFTVESGRLVVYVNNTYFGPLTAANVSITGLQFTTMSSSRSTAVKVDMTLEATSGSVTESKSYHATVILKGS